MLTLNEYIENAIKDIKKGYVSERIYSKDYYISLQEVEDYIANNYPNCNRKDIRIIPACDDIYGSSCIYRVLET